jgi:hypothetical protein
MRREDRGVSHIGLLRFVALVVSASTMMVVPPASLAQTDWKKHWDATVEAGRKEGEVVIYGPHNPAYQQIWANFQKTSGSDSLRARPGSDHAQRIVAERRAGKFLADLIMGGSTFCAFAPGTRSRSGRC